MRGANLALPWVIFERDRLKFAHRFPSLRIKDVRYHSALTHVLAGAFSLRSMVPPPLVAPLFAFEKGITRLAPKLGAMMTIDVEKGENRTHP